MTFDIEQVRKGYLPDGLPPSFSTAQIASHFSQKDDKFLSEGLKPVRAAIYSASKRGMTRRAFSIIHPMSAFDLAKFIADHEVDINAHFGKSSFSSSRPEKTPDGMRSVKISAHSDVDFEIMKRFSGYRYIAKTDISRFYHSIYTHSIPWAFHGKNESKADKSTNSAGIFCNKLDYLVRQGQDGQTIGIPVGPDASRYIAEIVATGIDCEFRKRCAVDNITVLRHVDDVWIGAHAHADAEHALWRYREAMREFELDINESKTNIFEKDYKFSEVWPFEINNNLDMAKSSSAFRKSEKLRAALEIAFSRALTQSDEGVLKYTIRQLDRGEFSGDIWSTIEPFLMRAAVHFGHTIDYVAKLVVWRKLTGGEYNVEQWKNLVLAILDRNGRLGNDSEVCWALYVALRLKIKVPIEIANNIIRNCGAMSMLSMLNLIEMDLAEKEIFQTAMDYVKQENGSGNLWPVMLEWISRKWVGHERLSLENDIIRELSDKNTVLFNEDKLPKVFEGLMDFQFSTIANAIEDGDDAYDEEESIEGPPEDGLDF